MRKTVPKSDRIGLRISPRNKLGCEILATRHGLSVSTLVEKAVEDLLKKEGLASVKDGEIVSLLDRLLPLGPGMRILEIARYRPDLLSAVDRVWLAQLEQEASRVNRSLYEDEIVDPSKIEQSYVHEWGAWP